MNRSEKLAEARRLLDEGEKMAGVVGERMIKALRLTLDLIETEKEEKPTGPNYSAHEERAWNEAWEKKHRRESSVRDAPLAPAPDFAAMAMQVIGGWTTLGKPCSLDHRYTVSGMDVATALRSWWPDWIRANGPKPAPAVVRDAAWWLSLVRRIEEAENVGFDNVPAVIRVLQDTFGQDPAPSPAPRSPSAAVALDALQSYADGDGATDLRNVAALVAGVKPELYYPPPAPSPAFDVEALIAGVQPYWAKHGCTVHEAIRAVAREMRKEGVR